MHDGNCLNTPSNRRSAIRRPRCRQAGLRVAWSGRALVVLLALAGCAAPPLDSGPSAGAVVPVPAALLADGVPPIPQALADAVARHAGPAGHGLAAWHPTRRELLVTQRPAEGSVRQLWRLPPPPAAAERLTDGDEPVGSARYAPGDGRFIVLARAQGGDEAWQLYRQDLPGGRLTHLTDPDQRHSAGTWLRQDRDLVGLSVPLDRTASGGRRASVDTTLWLMDPERPASRQVLASLPGVGWSAAAASQVWLFDLSSGKGRQVLPAAGSSEPPASHRPVGFSPDGRQLYLLSDRFGEHRALVRLNLADGTLAPVGPPLGWDVEQAELSPDGQAIALRLNVDGRDELRLLATASGEPRALPALPAGSVTQVLFHPRRNELALTISHAHGAGQLYTLDLDTAQLQAWGRPHAAEPPGASRPTPQEIVRWTSFDGRRISGLIQRPPARFSGRRPVLVQLHGGPASQAKVGFAGRQNYLVQDLGITIVQPNVRGSAGYGKTFLALDNGRLREDAVKDIGALLDWIATQPDLDPARVVVSGGSYGGYLSLAVAIHHAERIAGAVDVVGISHFVTFLESTETYRRDLRRAEYGDERDPAMRAFLHQISPLTHAHRITRPLLVVQGANDPRVPVTEAEQIVARVRANGGLVWYLRADNEGHGFARKENADYQFLATVMFLKQVLRLAD
jgi:dipeptidyl aminopeptidase/acylaminoacyl peptidase